MGSDASRRRGPAGFIDADPADIVNNYRKVRIGLDLGDSDILTLSTQSRRQTPPLTF